MLAATVISPLPTLASAQSVQPSGESEAAIASLAQPITPQQRREWVTDGILAPKSLGAGVMIGTWQTAIGSPREWQGSSGFTKRVLTNQADNGISKGLEASLGMLWGEDPRSTPSGRHSFNRRLAYAMMTVVVAQRPDGHLAPAWGRFAGAIGSNVVKNAWLPSRLTTPKETAGRVAAALLGRLATNLLEEFGPDLRRRLPRGLARRPTASRKPAPAAVPSTPLDPGFLRLASSASESCRLVRCFGRAQVEPHK